MIPGNKYLKPEMVIVKETRVSEAAKASDEKYHVVDW